MCVVYGFQLLVKVLFVFTVGLGFSWTITVIIFNDHRVRVPPPYLFLCIYHLPKRHMMSNFLYSFINFLHSLVSA
jgi:hypothetical protein